MTQNYRSFLGAFLALAVLAAGVSSATAQEAAQGGTEAGTEAGTDGTYTEGEILARAKDFFGATTKGLAKALENVFEDQGRPNAYITGEEVSGAIGIGVRYGEGTLNRKTGATRKVYWQGPTIGFDLGADASKMFILIYRLPDVDSLFQRFPAIDGSFYFIAGLGVNYQQSGDIIQAPIRTGVGLRAGINVGYMHYTREFSWIPL
ncbi:MAG: DUF1134 domain-containing protein [Alphaproteobacteria bacterium]